MDRKQYIVNAQHVAPKYAAVDKLITVSHDKHFGWAANGFPYGCGHSCKTPEAAIRDLLMANGCTHITMREI